VETRSFGTTTERLVRAALFMMLVDVFALMFLWDGYVGYQADNAAQLVELLGMTDAQSPPVNPRVTKDKGVELAATLGGDLTATSIENAFGPSSLKHGDAEYYVGPGGWLSVTRRGEKVTQVDWTDGKHTVSDQAWQRYIGYVLALVSLYATFGFMKTASSRITLGDEGVRVFGRPAVAWDAIAGISCVRSGVFTVDVADGDAIEIDGYSYKNVDQIVGAICERKGFANPLTDQSEPRP
jgi:hypothetical protein